MKNHCQSGRPCHRPPLCAHSYSRVEPHRRHRSQCEATSRCTTGCTTLTASHCRHRHRYRPWSPSLGRVCEAVLAHVGRRAVDRRTMATPTQGPRRWGHCRHPHARPAHRTPPRCPRLGRPLLQRRWRPLRLGSAHPWWRQQRRERRRRRRRQVGTEGSTAPAEWRSEARRPPRHAVVPAATGLRGTARARSSLRRQDRRGQGRTADTPAAAAPRRAPRWSPTLWSPAAAAATETRRRAPTPGSATQAWTRCCWHGWLGARTCSRPGATPAAAARPR